MHFVCIWLCHALSCFFLTLLKSDGSRNRHIFEKLESSSVLWNCIKNVVQIFVLKLLVIMNSWEKKSGCLKPKINRVNVGEYWFGHAVAVSFGNCRPRPGHVVWWTSPVELKWSASCEEKPLSLRLCQWCVLDWGGCPAGAMIFLVMQRAYLGIV